MKILHDVEDKFWLVNVALNKETEILKRSNRGMESH